MEDYDARAKAGFFCCDTVNMAPLSNKLKKLMGRWNVEKKTQPRRNTLASKSAARMTRQQIINLLNANLVLYPNTLNNIEHRMRNLAIQNNIMRRYMNDYIKRKRR